VSAAFALSPLITADVMHAKMRITGNLHVEPVMGARNAMPIDRPNLAFSIAKRRRHAPPMPRWSGAWRIPAPNTAAGVAEARALLCLPA
jgi:hypothetical protein